MEKEVPKKWFDILEGWVERLINAICVGAITIQVIAILIMVFGRYFSLMYRWARRNWHCSAWFGFHC